MADDAGWRPLRHPVPWAGQPGATAFHRLAVAHTLSLAGDALVTVALAGSLFFNISPGAARGRVALSLVLTMAPFAVVAPWLGPAIDRVRGGRRFMVGAAAAGRVVAALLAAAWLHGLLLFPAAFAVLVLSKTHAVAKSSLVPSVVDDSVELVSANARLALAGVVVGTIVAVPGVIVLQLVGAEWVMRLAAVVFAAGAVASLRIVQVHPNEPPARSAAMEELRHAGTRLAAIATGALRAAVGFLTFLIAFGFRRGHEPAWVFGLVLAASTLGTVVGSLVAPALRRRIHEEHLLAGALGLVAVVMIVAVRTGGRPAAILAAGAVGISASAGKLAFDSLVQRDAPAAAVGRAFARFEAMFQLAWVAAALLPVVLRVPVRAGYALLALGSTMTAAGYLTGLAANRRLAAAHRRLAAAHHPATADPATVDAAASVPEQGAGS